MTLFQFILREGAWHFRQARLAWRAWRLSRRTGIALEDARALVRLCRTDAEIDSLREA